MTDHPYPNIWDAIAARLEVEPLPAGECKPLGAVQHAQAEPDPETTERTDTTMSDVVTIEGVGEVAVYRVGVLEALWHAWVFRHRPGESRQRLLQQWRHLRRRARAGDWRAVRNSFNGFLAEPVEFPPGAYRRRCGSGWTQAAALRSLRRRLP